MLCKVNIFPVVVLLRAAAGFFFFCGVGAQGRAIVFLLVG